MDIPESEAHSFIIKLWVEDDESGRIVWHGHITHVPDGTRCYLQDLGDILTFVGPYVEGMGAVTRSSLGPRWLNPWAGRKR